MRLVAAELSSGRSQGRGDGDFSVVMFERCLAVDSDRKIVAITVLCYLAMSSSASLSSVMVISLDKANSLHALLVI